MFFSIIIPTLNEEAHLASLLEHLHTCLRGSAYEIIVADGGSTDHTVAIARPSGVSLIEVPVRCRASQMNAAVAVALGDVLYFVHADTVPPKSFVADIQQAIASGKSIGGYRFRFNPNKGLLRFNSFMTRFNLLSFRGGDQTLFITQKAWKEIGPFNEKFVVMEEYDLLRRAQLKGYGYHLMRSEVLVSNRKYAENSWLRVNFANVVAMLLFRLNASPAKIKKIYSALLKHSIIGYRAQ